MTTTDDTRFALAVECVECGWEGQLAPLPEHAEEAGRLYEDEPGEYCPSWWLYAVYGPCPACGEADAVIGSTREILPAPAGREPAL